MSEVNKHKVVSIAIAGLKKVAFITPHGWVNEASVEIDAVDSSSAAGNIQTWLKGLEPAPFENDAGNQQFVQDVTDQLECFALLVGNNKDNEDPWELTHYGDFSLEVQVTPSYEVNFS